MREYRIDDVMQVIESESFLEDISSDAEILFAVLTYCTSESEILATKICALNDDMKGVYLERLISIYPLSKDVVERLVTGDDQIYSGEQLLMWFDVGEIMFDSLMRFRNRMSGSQNTLQNIKGDFENVLEQYKIESQKLEAERQELKKLDKDKTEKRLQLEALRREVEELRAEYSEEGIDKQIKDLEEQKRKLEARKKEAATHMSKLNRELRTSSKTSEDFKKAFEALDAVMKTISKDGSEND